MSKKIPLIEMFGPTVQGEAAVIGQQTYFMRFGLCDYQCKMCIEESQRVLMADLSAKPISQIQVGDMVMGMVDSHERVNKRIVSTKVLNVINQGNKPVVRLTTRIGGRDKKGLFDGVAPASLLCTPDHKILNTKWRTYWQAASTCTDAVLRAVAIYTKPDDLLDAYWLGWLHGAFMGDGSIHKFQDRWWRMKMSCGDLEIRDKAFDILTAMNAPNPRKIMHDGGNGVKQLPSVEVTTHKWVEAFNDNMLLGKDTSTYKQGWLAGFFDTDGHFDASSFTVRIGQSIPVNQHKIDRYTTYAKDLGFSINWQESINRAGNIQKLGIISKCMEFFSLCQPILRRKYPYDFPIGKMPRAPVASITDQAILGNVPVWDITTETGNFICEGIIVHNCDSLHAVLPLEVRANATWLTPQEIWQKFYRELWQIPSTKWVTFSGGNPCIHDLSELVTELNTHGFQINVETQGTFAPTWLNQCSLVTVSPKGPGMGETTDLKVLDKFYERLLLTRRCTKIVVFDERDLEFARLIMERYQSYTGEMFLSLGNFQPPPPNSSVSNLSPVEHHFALIGAYKKLFEAIKYDKLLSQVRFLPQLHQLVWGDERGR